MKITPLRIITEDAFWAIERDFTQAHSDRGAPLNVEARSYDTFFEALLRQLSKVGTVTDDGMGDAMFCMSRYVDPNDVTVVVSDTATVFHSGGLKAALLAITEFGMPHMVIFDTGSYIAVLPDGSVIGYSEVEDLSVYISNS